MFFFYVNKCESNVVLNMIYFLQYEVMGAVERCYQLEHHSSHLQLHLPPETAATHLQASIHTFAETGKICCEVLVYSAEIINGEINLVMSVGGEATAAQFLD